MKDITVELKDSVMGSRAATSIPKSDRAMRSNSSTMTDGSHQMSDAVAEQEAANVLDACDLP